MQGSGSYVSLKSIGEDRQQAAIVSLQGMLYALEFRTPEEAEACLARQMEQWIPVAEEVEMTAD